MEGSLIGRLGEQLDRGSHEQRDRWTDRVDNAVSCTEWEGWLWGPWAWRTHTQTHTFTQEGARLCVYVPEREIDREQLKYIQYAVDVRYR